VTTRNEERSIAACLNSLKRQDYPRDDIEIIVVDNASSDKTKEISSRYTYKIYDYGPERSAQRNFGARQAGGKYILYLDADMILSSRVISECVEASEKNGFIALYIPEKIIGNGYWIRARNFERGFYNATCIDAVRFVRREKMLSIGGFDENLTGPEDWDFDRRIKAIGNVGLISSCIFHNEGGFDFKRYVSKKAYYSKTFAAYRLKWGNDDKIIRKQLGFLYRFLIVFIEQGKWKRLISRPDLALGMYMVRLSVGVGYVYSCLLNYKIQNTNDKINYKSKI
jgi:glycosyltransferase involved in cell wall biosynthesis